MCSMEAINGVTRFCPLLGGALYYSLGEPFPPHTVLLRAKTSLPPHFPSYKFFSFSVSRPTIIMRRAPPL